MLRTLLVTFAFVGITTQQTITLPTSTSPTATSPITTPIPNTTTILSNSVPTSQAVVDQQQVPKFRVCWSIYVGWMPWPFAQSSGVLKKYADMYGIEIELVQVQSYMDSIIRFAAGDFDACTMTNGDALSLPLVNDFIKGVRGVSKEAPPTEATGLIIGSWSNGNDGIVSTEVSSVGQLKGKRIGLEQGTVSQFLLARALAKNNISLKDVELVNIPMNDLVNALASNQVGTIVTWNPILLQALNQVQGSKMLFNSSSLPGEIVDLLVANKQKLTEYPQFGYALVQAWYETLGMVRRGEGWDLMADLEGSTDEEFQAELSSTKMMYGAADAVSFFSSETLVQSISNALHYVFDRGYLDGIYNSTNEHGIYFPIGVMGDAQNIQLYFDDRYTKLAGSTQK